MHVAVVVNATSLVHGPYFSGFSVVNIYIAIRLLNHFS